MIARPDRPAPRRIGRGRRPRRTTLVVRASGTSRGRCSRALRAFAERGVNLSKLESRPSRSAAWEYVFWADLDADAADPATAAALGELGAVTTMVRVLGSYPAAVDGLNDAVSRC